MDWVGTIDVLVKEKNKDEEGKDSKTKMSAKVLAEHFHLTVGSIMQYYSVWGNLHDKAREDIIAWGDIDYATIGQRYSIAITEEEKQQFDDVEVVQKTAMYPAIWNRQHQTEAYQCKVAERILMYHLKRKPPKALNSEQVKHCKTYVTQADHAEEALVRILNDCKCHVDQKIITPVDATPIRTRCEKLLKEVRDGRQDGKLTLPGEYPSSEILRLFTRFDAIKQLVYERKQEEEARKKAAEDAKMKAIAARAKADEASKALQEARTLTNFFLDWSLP